VSNHVYYNHVSHFWYYKQQVAKMYKSGQKNSQIPVEK